jgi:hypothetical protein
MQVSNYRRWYNRASPWISKDPSMAVVGFAIGTARHHRGILHGTRDRPADPFAQQVAAQAADQGAEHGAYSGQEQRAEPRANRRRPRRSPSRTRRQAPKVRSVQTGSANPLVRLKGPATRYGLGIRYRISGARCILRSERRSGRPVTRRAYRQAGRGQQRACRHPRDG